MRYKNSVENNNLSNNLQTNKTGRAASLKSLRLSIYLTICLFVRMMMKNLDIFYLSQQQKNL